MSVRIDNAVLPNVQNLEIGTRDFVVSILDGKKRRQVRLEGVEAQCLLRHVLYTPTQSGDQFKEGEVLSRNLDVTDRVEQGRDHPWNHFFSRYRDGVYPALRSFMRMPVQYVRGEVPRLNATRRSIRFLTIAALKLRQSDKELEAQFTEQMQKAAEPHARARNEMKVLARDELLRASSVIDTRGRRNPCRLPLMLWSSDTMIARRVGASRGIARRMDFRALLLADLLDQIFSLVGEISTAVMDLHEDRFVFGPDASPRRIREAAGRMSRYAQNRLSVVHLRPFCRSMRHASSDLLSCAEALESGKCEHARALLRRIHRSMVLLEHHRRLEEVLMVVAEAHHLNLPLHASVLWDLLEELRIIRGLLSAPEPMTHEMFEHGFQRRILPRVLSSIDQARAAVVAHQRGGTHLSDVYGHLKDACAPF